MSKSKLWQGLATTTSVLLTTSIIASGIADVKASQINSWLGTSNYKVVETGGEATSDGSYFDSEYSTLEEMIQAQTDVAVQLAAEGSVLLKNNNEALPIDKETEKVTLWGLNSAEPVLGGLVGSTAAANAEEGQTAYGIEEAMQERGFSLNSTLSLYNLIINSDLEKTSCVHSTVAYFKYSLSVRIIEPAIISIFLGL